MKVTVPVGVPDAALTVALKVTGLPNVDGFVDDASVVVVEAVPVLDLPHDGRLTNAASNTIVTMMIGIRVPSFPICLLSYSQTYPMGCYCASSYFQTTTASYSPASTAIRPPDRLGVAMAERPDQLERLRVLKNRSLKLLGQIIIADILAGGQK